MKLYFKDPNQLLSLFADLEDENLGLIEQCQEAEDRLETVKKKTSEVKKSCVNIAKRIFLSIFFHKRHKHSSYQMLI